MEVATDAIILHLAGNEAKANHFMEKYHDRFHDLARDNPTAVLHMWLREHIDNPIPTKAEKMLLAIVTKMTLTEVSDWSYYAHKRMQKNDLLTDEQRVRSKV